MLRLAIDENHAAGQRNRAGSIRGCERAVREDMARSLGGRRRAEAVALPGWIKPQLTKVVDRAPDGPEGLHDGSGAFKSILRRPPRRHLGS